MCVSVRAVEEAEKDMVAWRNRSKKEDEEEENIGTPLQVREGVRECIREEVCNLTTIKEDCNSDIAKIGI